MRRILTSLAFAALLGIAPVSAEDAKPFVDNTNVDLLTILPPPPANDSMKTKEELGAVLTIQVTRSADEVARATADDEDIWRFADVVGSGFEKEKLPLVAAFFDRIAATEGAVVDPAKKVFNRPRPYQLSELAIPVLDRSKSASWPSGHATLGTLMGIELSRMLPEKREAIMTRAWEYGWNRVVAGMHYPSDIDMGRIAGSAIAVELPMHDDFKAEYDAARKELRAALGLGT